MSSTRRTANEINILAMLDRHEAAGLPRRLLRRLRGWPAAAWYGTAGVLVCALVGVLAWLARDGEPSASVDSALAGAVTVTPAAAIAAAPPEPLAQAASDAPPEPEPEPAAPLQPQQEHAGRIAQQESARDPERVAAHAATGKSTPRAAAGKPGASGSRAAALARAEPRHKRPAVQPKVAPEPVDTDVALITAIIQHASKRQEAEDAARKP